MTSATEKIIDDVRRLLAGAKCGKVLLFGSRVEEKDGVDSDVDLIIILDRYEPFDSFSERSNVVLDLRRRLDPVSIDHGLDLIVFTRSEWESFIARESSFSREVQGSALEVA